MTPLPTDRTLVAERKRALREDSPVHPLSDLDAWHSTVLFSPHQDDESLGCGGLIATLTDRERHVRVVYITDGGMSHPRSRDYPREARAELRRGEAVTACGILGVAEKDVHFMNLPDGGVVRQWQEGFGEEVQRILTYLEEWRPDTLLVPFRRDLHPDHRATWELCKAAVERYDSPVRWIEYPVWMWEATNVVDLPREEELIVWRLEIAEQLGRKEAAVQAHASQLGRVIHDDPEGFRLVEEMLDHFRLPTEVYFEEASKRERSLSEDYFRSVYAAKDDPWDFESSVYERDKYAATLAALPQERYARGFEIGCSIGVLTELLAERCATLLAVDATDAPLERARERLAGREHVTFRKMQLPSEFPEGTFDLIVLSEVGYYWGYADLDRAIELIRQAVEPGGTLILVHYTPYIPDYPLTGDEVHEAFTLELRNFYRIRSDRAERYRLDVWKRKGGKAPTE